MARGLLSVPATGAEVERLFNSARYICHYRPGYLNESTMQYLMMFMCSEKFILDSQQLSNLEKLSTRRDTQETLEREEALKANEETLTSSATTKRAINIHLPPLWLRLKRWSRRILWRQKFHLRWSTTRSSISETKWTRMDRCYRLQSRNLVADLKRNLQPDWRSHLADYRNKTRCIICTLLFTKYPQKSSIADGALQKIKPDRYREDRKSKA